MTLEEIKLLEHIEIVEENENYIIIKPDTFYYIQVKDIPEDVKYYKEMGIIKQPEYSQMTVKSIFENEIIDSSITDNKIINSSILDNTSIGTVGLLPLY